MKLKVCADYSFIAIAFSCQAENCCHPVSENNKYLSVQICISTLYATDRLTIGSLHYCAFYPSAGKRTDVSVSSKKYQNQNNIKSLLESSSYPKDTGDV